MKNKHNFILIIMLVSFLATGCATIPPKLEKPIEKSKVFEASFDETWKALIQAITSEGEFMNVAQKESGLITFQKSIAGAVNEYALAPSGMTWQNATAYVNVIVTNENKIHTRININTKIIGQGQTSAAVFWYGIYAPVQQIEMGSRGYIEKNYFDKIESTFTTKKFNWLEEGKRPLMDSYFNIGSTQEEVLNAQGTPASVLGEVWRYGTSSVTFKNGKVIGYNNSDLNLKIKLK